MRASAVLKGVKEELIVWRVVIFCRQVLLAGSSLVFVSCAFQTNCFHHFSFYFKSFSPLLLHSIRLCLSSLFITWDYRGNILFRGSWLILISFMSSRLRLVFTGCVVTNRMMFKFKILLNSECLFSVSGGCLATHSLVHN